MRSLGHYAYRWRGRVVLVAFGVAVAAGVIGSTIFDAVKPFGFQDPASESSRATEALERASGERPMPDVVLLAEPAEGDARLASATARAERELGGVPGVARIVAPEDDSGLISKDGDAGLVLGYLEAGTEDPAEVGREIELRFRDLKDTMAGGAAVTAHQLNTTTENDLRRIELYAAPLLLLLSLLVFRGLVAALLPMVIGGLSIVSTLCVLRLLTNVVEIDLFAINVVTALGLGLAIDYSLFLVSRYREELERHGPTGRALRETMGAIGPMVVFSGLTVAVAMASLIVFPQRFLYSMGIGGALVALLSAIVVLVVLPALLALLGERVNALALPRREGREDRRRWYRLARGVMRYPVPIATVVAALMVVAGLPFLRVELTRADSRVLPVSASARQVDSVIEDRFEVNPSHTMLVALEPETPKRTEPGDSTAPARRELQELREIRGVGRARREGGLRVVQAELIVPPYSDAALDAVDRARGLAWGSPARVSGPSAELADQRDSLADHLPFAIAIVVFSTALILLVMTRSLTLPLVALLMNGLTVSVAFGSLVLIFQDGRLEGTLDYVSRAALDTSMPILLFALAFGLSTDYGVFLLQRISEERARGVDDSEAVAIGLERSGSIITAAALLFAVAMGAFVFSDLIFLKQVAVGTAVAVLVDATVVRALLFPSVLRILGPAAWWAPVPLRRR